MAEGGTNERRCPLGKRSGKGRSWSSSSISSSADSDSPSNYPRRGVTGHHMKKKHVSSSSNSDFESRSPLEGSALGAALALESSALGTTSESESDGKHSITLSSSDSSGDNAAKRAQRVKRTKRLRKQRALTRRNLLSQNLQRNILWFDQATDWFRARVIAENNETASDLRTTARIHRQSTCVVPEDILLQIIHLVPDSTSYAALASTCKNLAGLCRSVRDITMLRFSKVDIRMQRFYEGRIYEVGNVDICETLLYRHTVLPNGCRHGAQQTVYPDGVVRTISFYTEGLQDGPFLKWYSSGRKAVECRYLRGKLHGSFKTWWDVSRMCVWASKNKEPIKYPPLKRSECTYDHGLRQGLAIGYTSGEYRNYPTKVRQVSYYIDDRIQGKMWTMCRGKLRDNKQLAMIMHRAVAGKKVLFPTTWIEYTTSFQRGIKD